MVLLLDLFALSVPPGPDEAWEDDEGPAAPEEEMRQRRVSRGWRWPRFAHDFFGLKSGKRI